MKKISLIIIILLLTTGCSQNTLIEQKKIEISNLKGNIYYDDNPIKVGLYQGNKLVTSYDVTLANFKEIGVLGIYYTNIETLDSSYPKYNYQKYYKDYESIDKYKVGFEFNFEADGKEISCIAKDPSSKHAMTPYLYIYFYDDVNQADGAWYSHLEKEDMKDNTVISSIKLFLAQEGTKITSPITMTVFTYDDDDFDESGHYRGNSKYTITINTKK